MLYVYFSGANRVNGIKYSPSSAFENLYNKDWLNKDFSKRVIRDIDNSEHIKDNYIESPILGAIPPNSLSNTAKNLILLDNTSNLEYMTDLEFIGNNGLKFLVEIAGRKDIYCTCSNSIIDFSDIKDFKCICLNNNEIIVSNSVFVSSMYRYIEETIDKEEDDIMRYLL